MSLKVRDNHMLLLLEGGEMGEYYNLGQNQLRQVDTHVYNSLFKHLLARRRTNIYPPLPLFIVAIDHIRILTVGLELAYNQGLCGGIFSNTTIFNDIPLHEPRLQLVPVRNRENTNNGLFILHLFTPEQHWYWRGRGGGGGGRGLLVSRVLSAIEGHKLHTYSEGLVLIDRRHLGSWSDCVFISSSIISATGLF